MSPANSPAQTTAVRGAAVRGRVTPDQQCADAVGLARAAAEEAAGAEQIGEHIGVTADDTRVVTHLFECRLPGYRGWRWAVTVARASRARTVTLDETVLLPGPDALLAPEWVPWHERLRPGDLGPGDLLPAEDEDLRLEPGLAVGEEELEPAVPGAPAAAATEGAEGAERAEGAEGPDAEAVAEAAPSGGVPRRAEIAAIADELGMTRHRVLSRYGLHTAADRWEDEFGPKTPMAQAAPASCVSCGFLMPLAGSLRRAFGVCANEFAPADGHVVSLAYGCGAHSEAALMPKPVEPAPPVLDTMGADPT
ncbi:DUF3027 domain-containing protein [Streptomyces sp. WMMC500]|uniref:DUF3027 domain-containing protein n=1 Tax=Streptomyces sp. WMMC500 TaxID=3015154 RepID=UPI00248B5769|nr:DUF3027 domain-containing protein [Streptomyces sp. WMMC500]WBB58575.1 DUF3027 domain-containing protein [Streptomyces sp. WMMC500]